MKTRSEELGVNRVGDLVLVVLTPIGINLNSANVEDVMSLNS